MAGLDVVALVTDAIVCAAIVPTLDRPQTALACVRALAAARPGFAEIVVADQADDDSLRPGVETLGARYLRLGPPGLSRARNAAIAVTRSPWLFFPDDDCTVDETVLAGIGRGLARHPTAAFACAHVATPAGQPLQIGLDGRERALVAPLDVLSTVLSTGLFVRRDALERAGGFDEQFGLGGRWGSGEESDLLFRLLAIGETGVYAPEARVVHPEPYAGDAQTAIARALAYGRGWGALFAKHAAGSLGPQVRGLHRRYLVRALGGAVLASLTLRPEIARRYLASYRGRRGGFRDYLRERRLA